MEIIVGLFVLLVAGYFLYTKFCPPVSEKFVEDSLKTLKEVETKVEAEATKFVEEVKVETAEVVEEVKVAVKKRTSKNSK